LNPDSFELGPELFVIVFAVVVFVICVPDTTMPFACRRLITHLLM
jgi:hypothetical protein